MIEDEVREALEELVREIAATSAQIVDDEGGRSGVPARTLPLGAGEYLRVELASRAPRTTGREHELDAAIERAVRQLRAIRRRWELARLPAVAVCPGAGPTQARVADRIRAFLAALAAIDRAQNALVTRGGKLVAAVRPPDELEAARWPFLARRTLATHAPGSSHGEVVDRDAYAMSFWYDAVLIVLVAEPYAVDFVRHRCRQVARELCNLLPLLEPDPDTPAAIRPPPG